MFFKKLNSGVDWLIVGLGNPGKKFAHTRHNVGFDALDKAAEMWKIDIKRLKFDALCGQGEVNGHKVLLLKPQTFMNLSGTSVRKAVDFYKLEPKNVLVLTDDISLEPGMLRSRKTGSAGGHKGLKDIIAAIGQDFPRIRIGVGEKPHPDYDLAAWVTGHFSANEAKKVQQRYEDVANAVLLIMDDKFEKAAAKYNGLGSFAK